MAGQYDVCDFFCFIVLQFCSGKRHLGENSTVSFVCMPKISGTSAFCLVFSQRGNRCLGSRIFHGNGIYGSYYHPDLQRGKDGSAYRRCGH